MLRIWLLGVLRIEFDGVEVTPPSSRRARLLVAMLAIDRGPHAREALAAKLWPGASDKSARASLRTALAQLRAALSPDAGRVLQATRESIALAGRQEVWTDVGEFERLLGAGQPQAALELLRGELLTGLENDWVYERRDELRQRLYEALGAAAGKAEAGGDLQTALALTRRQASLDPLIEEAQRELIRRLARAGDRAAALAVYNRLSQRLREQLGIAPSAATHDLVVLVRAGTGPTERGGVKNKARQDDGAAAPIAPPGEASVAQTRMRHAVPRSLASSAVFPFVGREAELECLHERWDRVRRGSRVAVVVAGEAGIGKTRLAAELARTVSEQGGLVLYGRCDEGLSVPYQPFVEALRSHAEAIGVDRLRAELGPLAAPLRRLFPELKGIGEPGGGDRDSERFALFEAVTALVEVMTRQQPALLVFDDLHWAARPTLLFLRYLIRCERPLRMLLVGTYRETELGPGQPLAQLLADLQRDASAEPLPIGGLGDAAIIALLEAAIGQRLDERGSELVRVLAAQTAGNPFFLRELLAHLAESGQRWDGIAVEELEIPEGLRNVIAQRIARLPAPAGRALNVAAVAGPIFSFRLLEEVTGERAIMLDALDEAVAAGLLSEVGHGDYAFVHALARQAIYEQLGSARRMRLHRQLGEAIEALGNTDVHVEELAHHFAQAAADGQSVKAARYALAAGGRATARLGYEDAVAHYERGLEALTVSQRPQDKLRCELLLALGLARWDAGELDTARQACQQAAEVADKLGDATALARAALGFCGPHRVEISAVAAEPVAGLLERALGALSDDNGSLRARLMGRLAAYTKDVPRRPLLAREALDMARRIGDRTALADVLVNTLWATHGPDVLQESLAVTRELERVADEIGDHLLQSLAYRWRLDFLLELGDIEAVQRQLDALQQVAEKRKERYVKWLLAVFWANHAHLGGRLEDCERLAYSALAHRLEGQDETAAQIFGLQLLFVRREQGRLHELVEPVAGFAAQYPEFVNWRCGLAYIYAELERRTEARRELDALARVGFSDITRDESWLSNLTALCTVASFLGDVPRAHRLYKLLLPYADRCVVTFALLGQGSASRALGLLATTLTRYEDAERHFEQALETNDRIRSRLWSAHTQHDYARMLLLRKGPRDRDKALRLLDEALATARQLGLTALTDKARPLKLAAEVEIHPSASARCG